MNSIIMSESYITMVKEFVRDVSNETRYKNFKDVLDVIIDYHNNYGKNAKGRN